MRSKAFRTYDYGVRVFDATHAPRRNPLALNTAPSAYLEPVDTFAHGCDHRTHTASVERIGRRTLEARVYSPRNLCGLRRFRYMADARAWLARFNPSETRVRVGGLWQVLEV